MSRKVSLTVLGIVIFLGILILGFFLLNIYIYNEEQVETSDDVEKESLNKEQTEPEKPVLKNLGVSIKAWNGKSDHAGDLFFTQGVLFEDDFIKNDKAFVPFGEMGQSKESPNTKNIEYWFFVKPGTKVKAAAGGVVRIFKIEHTDDWGVNISPTELSNWMVGHEHLVNLVVKEGDSVQAGDILGDATPHNSFGANLGFTELSVGIGGVEIVKYCPFDFLQEDLKPVYKEKLNQLASDWETFIGQDVYKENDWVSPGCLEKEITEQ